MAVVKNLMVRAGADFSAITTQSKKAGASMKRMQTGVGGACAKMSTAMAGLKKAAAGLGVALSFTAVVAGAKKAKEAYDEQAVAQAKLARVMRNTMDATDEQISSILELTGAQQKLGVIGDEVQLAGAQELATYLGLTDSLKTLLPVMNDMLAQQYGLNATQEQAVTIATMLGKVMNGQTGALSRYGYSFTAAQEAVLKYGDEAQRAATLSRVVEQSVGGMNAALAATPSGRLKQVSNTLGDIQESAGLAVNTLLTAFLPALNGLCSVLASVATLAGRVAQTIANVFGGGNVGVEKTVGYVTKAAEGMEDLTDETKAAGKATKELSTFGFDTLQQIKSTGSSSGGDVSSPDTAASMAGGSILYGVAGADEAGESVGWLQKALEKLRDTAKELNLDKLIQSLKDLKTSLEPFAEKVGEGLGWFYDNVLEPLAHWTMEEAAPAVLETLADAIDLVRTAVEKLQPLGKWFWDNFIKPMATVTGDAVLELLEDLASDLRNLNDLLSGKVSFGEFIRNTTLAKTVTGDWQSKVEESTKAAQASIEFTDQQWAELMEGIESGLNTCKESILDTWTQAKADTAAGAAEIMEHVQSIKTFFKEGFGAIGENISSTWEQAKTSTIEAWEEVKTNLSTAVDGIKTFFKEGFDVIGESISSTWEQAKTDSAEGWEKIKETWAAAGEWFTTNVTTPLSNGFKGMANGIIGFFEGLGNGGVDAINRIVDGLNKIHFETPDWVPLIGGKQFGFNLPKMGKISLPRLGQGDVIQPGKEFLAVLGDQQSGVNIEAPLETIKQAVSEAGGGAGGTLTVKPLPGFTQYMSYELEREGKRRGGRMIGGAT